MSELRDALEEYLAVRRALGVKLHAAGGHLNKFVQFAEQNGASHITTDLALRWATQPADAQPVQWANRLGMVRRFAQYCAGTDPRTEIPPQDLLPHRFHRKPPHIYTDDELSRLITAAQRLPSPRGLRASTYATLLGLLAVTGMRLRGCEKIDFRVSCRRVRPKLACENAPGCANTPSVDSEVPPNSPGGLKILKDSHPLSEPLALDREHVDLTQGTLLIRKTKFGKTRILPVHPTTQKALRRYVRLRDHIIPRPETSAFFISERGTRLTNWTVGRTFVSLSHQVGLRGPRDSHGPRLHDLRHGFAIRTLLDWYRAGANVEQHLPELATYLGHGHVTDTYWYLSVTPELLRLAMERLEGPEGGSAP